MKRKLLLQFADWLAKSRHPFDIKFNHQCVSAQAMRFAEGAKGEVHGSPYTLERIFKMDPPTAYLVFAPIHAGTITRKIAADMLRRLARTGRVEYKV